MSEKIKPYSIKEDKEKGDPRHSLIISTDGIEERTNGKLYASGLAKIADWH